MRFMARVLVIVAKYKGQTGTVIDFDSGTGLIIVGFDNGTKVKVEKADLLQINDLEDLEFEIGQKVYLSAIERVGEIISINDSNYTIRLQDDTITVTVLKVEKDFILE